MCSAAALLPPRTLTVSCTCRRNPGAHTHFVRSDARAITRMSHDKNDPLFCGFAEANFFATWENARFSRDFEQKSTEKYPVFIIGRLTRPVPRPFATFRITVLRSSRQLCAILSPIVRGDTHCNRHCGKRPSEGRAVASCSTCKPCLHLRILHRALYRNGFGIAVAVSPDAIWNHSLNDCLHRLKKL